MKNIEEKKNKSEKSHSNSKKLDSNEVKHFLLILLL